MPRFLILFNAPEPMTEFMARSTSEERQAGLVAWSEWKTEAEKLVNFEFGAVVQAYQRIEQVKLVDSPNQATNYAFAEASAKEDVVKALESHPHLKRSGASIDILEVLSMPT